VKEQTMKTRSFKQWLGVGALALGATIVQASFINAAQAAEEPGTVTVRVSDLNLASAADVATLYQRINSAASLVCAEDTATGAKLFGNAKARCVAASVARAVEQVHSSVLSAYHQQETAETQDARRRGA
jgi:UrcA family protein